MTRVFEPPIYCYHEIVHNRFVVEHFRSLGVVFVNDVADVPQGFPGDAERARFAAPGHRGRAQGRRHGR